MKNVLYEYFVLSIFFSSLLVGCGGSSKDSPGVNVSAVMTPTYNGVNTSSVDAVRSSCTNSTTTQLEYFADHTATASISANLINPSNIIKQITLYIDGYTITYNSHADSPGAPSIQSDVRNAAFSFIVSSATPTLAASMTVELVDLIRKNQYYSNTGGTLNNYTAVYTFQGHSENGVQFTFSAQTDFQIGNFNYCPSGFTPI